MAKLKKGTIKSYTQIAAAAIKTSNSGLKHKTQKTNNNNNT